MTATHWRDDRILPDDPHGLSGLDQEIRRDLKRRERQERRAYRAGLEGFAWDPRNHPPGDELMHQAWEAGMIHRRQFHRDRVLNAAAHTTIWLGKRLSGNKKRRRRR